MTNNSSQFSARIMSLGATLDYAFLWKTGAMKSLTVMT